MKIKSQQGFLSIINIVLILIIGFIGVALVYMFSSGSLATTQFLLSEQAFDAAEGGLEKATRYLLRPGLSGVTSRVTCSALTGNADLTNSSLGGATFTASTVSGSPFFVNSTLSSALNNSATTLSVANAAGFAAFGRIVIDREYINYTAISGNTFIGVTRGVDNTVASSHASGARVSQYQCSINSLGSISTLARSQLRQGVQLQDAWAVGARNGSNFVFTHWNRPNEIQWNSVSVLDSTNRENLNSVSVTSNADGWAVGVERNNNFILLRLQGIAWTVTALSGACNGQDLEGVSAVSSIQAFAVGARARPGCASSGNFRYTILYWNGSTWSELSPSSTPSTPADGTSTVQNLLAVHVIDTAGTGVGNFGFAVGENGDILRYNGSAWAKLASPVSQNLNGVYVVSTNEAWAVGNGGTIIRWNGSSWSAVSSPTGTQLNSVFMLDTNGDGVADAGWAVGNNGVAITYNGSTWSSQNAGGSNLLGVAAYSQKDVWAVGASGRVAHWDGTAWTNFTSNVSTQLNSVALVAPKEYPFSAWHEVYP